MTTTTLTGQEGTGRTLSIPAGELRRCIAAVLPHAGRDTTMPVLCTVFIHVTDGEFRAAATQMTTLAVADAPLSGAAAEGFNFLFDRADADLLIRTLKTSTRRHLDPLVTLTVDDHEDDSRTLTVTTSSGTTKMHQAYGIFPDYWPILNAHDKRAENIGEITLDPSLLGLFAKSQAALDLTWDAKRPMLQMRFCGEGMVNLRMGEHFRGVICPVR